jgi:hypothetical protein
MLISALILAAAAAAADKPRGLFSDEDYPIDARNNREEAWCTRDWSSAWTGA